VRRWSSVEISAATAAMARKHQRQLLHQWTQAVGNLTIRRDTADEIHQQADNRRLSHHRQQKDFLPRTIQPP